MDVPRLRYNCFLANNRQGSRQYVIANYSFIHDTPCRQNELAGKGSIHTSAKLIEIQKSSLQTRHGLHELGSHMESNHTLHGSKLGPHWVLGPKNLKFGPMEPKKMLKNFFTQS